MSDLGGGSFSHILVPAATDRVGLSTGPLTGGYSERGEFVYKDASGSYLCAGPLLINRAGWSGLGKLNVEGGADFTGGNVYLCRDTGNVAVGGASGAVRVHAKSTGEIMRLETTTARGSGGHHMAFHDPSGRSGYVGNVFANNNFYVANDLNGALILATNATERMVIEANGGAWRPGADNMTDAGSGSYRLRVVFSVTGTINTCDIRLKFYRAEPAPTADEHAAALECFEAFGFFQHLDAVAREADGGPPARWHFGPKAQEIWSIFASHGLIAALVEDEHGDLVPPEGSVPPAFLCFDAWGEETAPGMAWWRPSDTIGPDGDLLMVPCAEGEEGTEQRPTGETYVVRAAGNIFGVRIDQLQSLMLVALNKERLNQASTTAALEARIAALEAA